METAIHQRSMIDARGAEMPSARPARLTDNAQSRLQSSAGATVFGALVIAALYLGWQWRDSGYITAEEGLGYALGIVGGVMMAILLLYPLRKKQVPLLRWGPIRYWFRMHMLFGVMGPVVILYHADFKLGAINSNVALFCMLLVAGSGLVGRYFYTRMHYGLYGARTTLSALQQRATGAEERMAALFQRVPEALERLYQLERWLLKERSGFLRLLMLPLAALRCRYVQWHLLRMLDVELARQGQQGGWKPHAIYRVKDLASQFVSTYVETLRRVAEIGVYERLFSWWHILHLPLFIMMLLSGIVHVIAVHMY